MPSPTPPRTPRRKPRRKRREARGVAEHELLRQIRSLVRRDGRGAGVEVGIGDDAAVVRVSGAASKNANGSLVLTTDTMVEGIHYRPEWLDAGDIGVRAFRAAVSDIAAMGAAPCWVLLSLELPNDAAADALAIVRAVSREARGSGAALVGGNVSGGVRTAVTTTVIGKPVAKPVLRSTAKPGDLVFVTGRLGASGAGYRELLARRPKSPPSAAVRAFRRPPLRLAFAAALAERGLASSMIDLSDGLLQDLGHVADESRVAVRLVEEAIPVAPAARTGRGRAAALELAMTAGEDYELAFTARPSTRAAVETLGRRLRTPVAMIGTIEKRRRGKPAVMREDGSAFDAGRAGFDHFAGRGRR